jgi:hypothetical protein
VRNVALDMSEHYLLGFLLDVMFDYSVLRSHRQACFLNLAINPDVATHVENVKLCKMF